MILGQSPPPAQSVSCDLPSDDFPAWCPDDETRHNIVARRNVLLALWAGRLMGLSGARLSAYAAEVHLADFGISGDADVVTKITADLHRSGLSVRSCELRAKLGACHGEALRQIQVTD